MGLLKNKREKIETTTHRCPVCDFEFKGEYTTCPECGADLTGNAEPQNEEVNEFLEEIETEDTSQAVDGNSLFDEGDVSDMDDLLEEVEEEEYAEPEENFEETVSSEENNFEETAEEEGFEEDEELELNEDFDMDSVEEEEVYDVEEEEVVVEEEPVDVEAKLAEVDEVEDEEFREFVAEDEEVEGLEDFEFASEEPKDNAPLLDRLAAEADAKVIPLDFLMNATKGGETIVRKKGNGYELVTGGLIPVKVIEATDDEAELLVIDRQLKTENVPIVERARKYQREEELIDTVKSFFKADSVAELNNIEQEELERYISVAGSLTDKFEGVNFTIETAEVLAKMSKTNQGLVAAIAEDMGTESISYVTAKELASEKALDESKVIRILSQDNKTTDREDLKDLIRELIREVIAESR